MPEKYGVLIQLRWSNPYSEPPAGRPRVLSEIFRHCDDPEARKSPAEFDQLHSLGDGYSNYLCFPALAPMRELPAASLASVRRKRVTRRIEKKYPLFAGEFVKQELDRQPEYYAGITRPDLAEKKDEITRRESERLEYLEARRGQLLFYCTP